MSADEKPPIVTDDGAEVLRFTEFLADHLRGRTDEEISRALHDVIAEVAMHEKKGRVSLSIEVLPAGDNQIQIAVDVVPKAPRATAAPAHFYLDRAGNPTRHDPYQQRMFQEENHDG